MINVLGKTDGINYFIEWQVYDILFSSSYLIKVLVKLQAFVPSLCIISCNLMACQSFYVICCNLIACQSINQNLSVIQSDIKISPSQQHFFFKDINLPVIMVIVCEIIL